MRLTSGPLKADRGVKLKNCSRPIGERQTRNGTRGTQVRPVTRLTAALRNVDPWLWAILAAVTLLRALGAWLLPLTGDEAYYWEWSRHLAAGYVDHPPLVAYAIRLFAWLGKSPFAVRLPFVLCGIIAPLFAASTATYLTRDRRAGLAAGLAVALAPMLSIAFATASPDGPYLAAWSLTLYCAARAFREGAARWFAWLGIALGLTLLARIFGFALAVGIVLVACLPQNRQTLRSRFWVTVLTTSLVVTPFFFWNATHGWTSFVFSIFARHAGHAMALRPLTLQVAALIAFSPGLYLAAILTPARVREALLIWTAWPLWIALTLLAFREPIEVYWLDAPYLTLCVAAGIAWPQLAASARRVWSIAALAPALILLSIIFAATIVPDRVYGQIRHFGFQLSDNGAFEIFSYPNLSADVKRIERDDHAIAMTDGYGFSSLMDFYAGVTPVVIGYDSQGQESKRWFSDTDVRERRALFIDKVPLERRPDFIMQLHRACGAVRPGPRLTYPYNDLPAAGIPPRTYYTTWCEGLKRNGIAILRWETPN